MSYLLNPYGLATAGGEQAWLTGTTTGALRNNFSGWVGCRFTPSTSITVTHLGRIWLTGNSGTRTVQIWTLSPGGVLKASAVIDLSTGTNDQYNYTAVTPVVLNSGTPYYISSQETSGSIQWRDLATAPATCGHATCDIGGFHASDPSSLTNSGSGQLFVPVNFKHT